MRVLVTGASGQLGVALRSVLSDHEATYCDRKALDIADVEAVSACMRSVRPELVINAAAYTDVDAAESDETNAFRVNAEGPRHLAMVARDVRAVLIHVSTDYVFSGSGRDTFDEYATPEPINAYGRSKLAGEENVRSVSEEHIIVRTAWLYALKSRNFVTTMVALSNRPEVRVVADQAGSPTFVDHLAPRLLQLAASGARGTFHLAGRGGTSRADLARAIFRRIGSQTRVTSIATSEMPRPARRPGSTELVTVRTPRVELPPWEHGLDEFIERGRREGLF